MWYVTTVIYNLCSHIFMYNIICETFGKFYILVADVTFIYLNEISNLKREIDALHELVRFHETTKIHFV